MTWLKNKMNIGQIQMTIPILITLASTIVGSMLWITNIGATSKEADADVNRTTRHSIYATYTASGGGVTNKFLSLMDCGT